jgi:hypothetical protein
MPLKVHAPWHVELRWWWEASASSSASDESLHLRDPHAARRFVASLWAHPQHAAALRRFVRQGAPGFWSAPEDAHLIDRLAAAVASDRVRIARIPADRLSSWDEEREEAPPASAPTPTAEPIAPEEPLCMPCLKAAASARALREASADGSPFVVQD